VQRASAYLRRLYRPLRSAERAHLSARDPSSDFA
jgi:hypothetical protein